ncbi:MAG: butyrate kinase [Clostridiales Family XIII bacterium]|jgi:butyrate kinase|nr:butyrate kinase [Clostridiales Family XIII bacterium]
MGDNNNKYVILAINPGSTSTKIAIFKDEENLFQKNVEHSAEELAAFPDIPDQREYRRDMIIDAIAEAGFTISGIDAFVGRGGGLDPCEGGTYKAEGLLLEHARTCHAARHPATLGAVLADEFAKEGGKPAFIVDPPDIDELEPVARISGLKDFPRESRFHALNQREVARRAAAELGKTYETSRLVVGHLGGGVSVAAHKNGRVVDADDILGGDCPMAPTRAGQLTTLDVAKLCFSGAYDQKALLDLITKHGGVVDHLGTSDMQEVSQRAAEGDEYAALVFDALIYQVAKKIGAYAVALKGEVDAIVVSGGITYSDTVVSGLRSYLSFIAPLFVYPGEFEMEALANGALRVLRGEEEAKVYTGRK